MNIDFQHPLSVLKKEFKSFPNTLVVLGSGWNKVIDQTSVLKTISYQQLFNVSATVPGHEGRLILAKLKNKTIAFMSGRFHTYEGYSAYQATTPIRLFAKAGVKNLILTAACGALNEKFAVGDFVILSDLITLFLALDNPLKGPQFIDMSEVFDKRLRQIAIAAAVKTAISHQIGTYVYYHGPNFETPADKMALRFLGADVVGMSTVPEALVARSLNLKILGLAFVTNLAFVKHDHKQVLKEANKAGAKMAKLLEQIILNI